MKGVGDLLTLEPALTWPVAPCGTLAHSDASWIRYMHPGSGTSKELQCDTSGPHRIPVVLASLLSLACIEEINHIY